MNNEIAFLILGFAIGLAAYRIFMEYIMGTANPTICDFCNERRRKAERKKERESSQKK